MAAFLDDTAEGQYFEIDPKEIDSLITALANPDGLARQRVRHELVEMGEPAVEALIKALDVRNNYVHWQAAKALSQIASPRSIEILVKLLQDDDVGIRWIAADGLSIVGGKSLDPLLEALVHRVGSYTLREGAHHVLFDLLHHPEILDEATKEIIRPVYESLTGLRPAVSVQVAAHNALQQLRGGW